MKKIWNDIQKVYYQFDKILLLFASLFFVVEVIWVPINSFLAEAIVGLTGHAYLSPTSLLENIAEQWWIVLLLLVLVLINLLVAYLQIGFLFLGIRTLFEPKEMDLQDFAKEIFGNLKHLLVTIRVSKMLFVLSYSVILFPFLRRILRIYYFNKILVPRFLIDYVMQTGAFSFLLIGRVLLLILFGWLTARFMYVLPQIYYEQTPLKEAIRYSWQRTKGKAEWKSCWLFWWTAFKSILFFLLGSGALYGLQWVADLMPYPFSLVLAVVHFIGLQFIYYGAIALFLTKLLSFLTGSRLPFYRRERLRHRFRASLLTVAVLYFGVQGVTYLYLPFEKLPETISHRGVNGKNGVQNTLDSLEKTAKLQPDFVEMDVQETKDGKFVVMHDTDLEELTGYSGGTHDYTLEELTQMTVKEYGMKATMASFDDYLELADSLGQRLIVEIKTTPEDSEEMLATFLGQYANRLIENGHQMQSLDYQVVKDSKKSYPNLEVAFVLPFNSVYPRTVADIYTMEYTTLDTNFILKSWFREKGVYAWTPNTRRDMLQVIQLQVDGIITDEPRLLQSVLADVQQDQNYADSLWFYSQLLWY